MFAPRFALARCTLLLGLLVLPLALVALGANDPSDANKPAADVASVTKKSGDETPPPKKMVHASLLVHATEQRIWPGLDHKIDFEEFRFYKANLAAQMKSSFVINRALQDSSLKDNPLLKRHRANDVEWVADEIVVEFPGNVELMTVGMASDDPKSACLIVNAVVSAFMKEVVEKDRADRLGQLDILNRKLSGYRSGLRDKEQLLYTVSQHLGAPQDVVRIVRQTAEVEELIDKARRFEMQAELQIARAEHKAEGLAATSPEFKAAKSDADAAQVERKFWSAKVDSLRDEIQKLDEKRAANDRFDGDARQLRGDIESLQTVINEMGNSVTTMTINLGAEPRVRVCDEARAE